MATLYDPHGDQVTELPTDDPAHLGLADLMPRAIGEKKALLINAIFPRAARLNLPELMHVTSEPAVFESIAVFKP